MPEFLHTLTTEWWGILLICALALTLCVILSAVLYRQIFKRFYDILLSGLALVVLSPLLLILTVVGAVKMRGNPFFTQLRPGRIDKKTGKERIFKLIKFRTMTNETDAEGNLLPDEVRLNRYGMFLRSTSLDELPELINIFIGDMSIVGPRPLLVKYLPLYNETQRHRHNVRPGLTGLAQVKGRNAISWEAKFELDVEYVNNITAVGDLKIIFGTLKTVIKREGVNSETSATMEEFNGTEMETVE